MTKTSIKLATVAALALIAGGAASTSFAADVNYNSYGSVAFEASTDPTKPTDPTDPDPTHPVDPVNPDGSLPDAGTAGPLSIDFASSFDFGKQKITAADQTYYAAAQKFTDASGKAKEGPNYVQVSDNRGTLAGWTLSVTQGAQFTGVTTSTGKGSVLDGAVMTLGNGNLQTASDTKADVVAATTALQPGVQSGTILGATAGTGAGTQLLVFGDASTATASVSLMVPGSTTKLAQEYKTNLTWTLSDTPAA